MNSSTNIELYRDKSENFRSIHLEVTDAGSIRMIGQDMGENAERFWGDADYEFWVTVCPQEASKLIAALLIERYRNDPSAVDGFRDFCSRHGITHEYGSWV